MKRKISNKEIKFDHAPQEKLRFITKIWDEFLEKVLQTEGIASDESYLTDFHCLFTDMQRVIAEEGDYYIVEWKYRKDIFDGDWKTRRKKIPKIECVDYRQLYIQRTKDVFGVDIAPVYDKCIPEIMQYIAKHRK